MMHSYSLLLEIGAAKPFKLIHAGDTHLVYADDRDDERKNILAGKRRNVFPNAERYLEEISAFARNDEAVIVHTGDLIDFVSVKNIDAAANFCRDNDVFAAAGNHEFSQYVGEAFEDAAYRAQSLDKVQAAFTNDIRMSARVINGVKLIALDNGYYLFEKEQLEFLMRECAEGLPVILLMHTPLYTPGLHEYMLTVAGQPCGYLCGTPESEMSGYPESRVIQQKPDKITLETIEYIKSSPAIRCILTGHIHRDIISQVAPGLMQYSVGLDTVGRITVS